MTPLPGQLSLFPDQRDACFSSDRVYRYALNRIWDSGKPCIHWVMLNPSTADATTDDPTIRRCLGYTTAWGYGGILVSNLFALRATDPRELKKARDPVGPENDPWIFACTSHCVFTVCAWGNHGSYQARCAQVFLLLSRSGKPVYHLGLTKTGQPRHPLYLPGTLDLTLWESDPWQFPKAPSTKRRSTAPRRH